MGIAAKLALFLSIFGAVSAGAAPSFSCSGTLSPAEKVICADPNLGDKDRNLADAFSEALKTLGDKDRKNLIRSQQHWLESRDIDCGLPPRPTDFELISKPDPNDCLLKQYESRQWAFASVREARVNETRQSGPEEIPFPAKHYFFLPKLILSSDDDLCPKFLKALTDEFVAVHPEGPESVRRPDFAIAGARWLRLPSGPDNAFVAVDLDGNGKRSALIYKSATWGDGRSIFLLVQPVLDRSRLSDEADATDGPDSKSRLIGIKPFESGSVKFPDINPIHIFEYSKRYFFFDYFPGTGWADTTVAALRPLHSSGGEEPICRVQLQPRLSITGPTDFSPRWIEPDASMPSDAHSETGQSLDQITIPPDLAQFLGILARIQGEEGAVIGNGRSFIFLIAETARVNREAVVRPWNLLQGNWEYPNQKTGDRIEAAIHGRTDVAIHDWGMRSLSNFRALSSYRIAKPKARTALTSLYQEKFGLEAAAADRAAGAALDRVVALSFIFPSAADYEYPLAVTLDDTAILAEIARHRVEHDVPQSPQRAEELLRWALLIGAPRDDIDYLIANGAVLVDKPPANPFDETSPKEPTIFSALEHPALLEALIDKGADVEATNMFGKTALMYAAQYDLKESIRILLRHHAELDLKTTYREDNGSPTEYDPPGYQITRLHRTALMYAAENASAETIRMLLNAGASPSDKDTGGDTVGMYFARNAIVTPSERAEIQQRLAR